MSTEKTETIRIKNFSIIGTPDKVYPELLKIRKAEKVVEEIISLTPFEEKAPQLNGIQSIAPQMSMMMCCFIVCEDQGK